MFHSTPPVRGFSGSAPTEPTRPIGSAKEDSSPPPAAFSALAASPAVRSFVAKTTPPFPSTVSKVSRPIGAANQGGAHPPVRGFSSLKD